MVTSRRGARLAAPLAGALALAAADARAADPPPTPPTPTPPKTPPLHSDLVQYGAAFTVASTLSPGDVCPGGPGAKPCILGSGGGLSVRAGYRNPGPFYLGGAYEFTKMDSSNLYRLGIFQQLRLEGRYYFDTGTRLAPFLGAAAGVVAYGSEWGIETGGGTLGLGAGLQIEVSRTAVVGTSFHYRPALISSWTDTAGQARPTGLAHLIGLELLLEVRSELGRR